MKKITNIMVRTAVIGAMSTGMVGVALADSVDVGTTGPDSVNDVSVTNTTSNTVTNNNNVEIVNSNEQFATSGNVDVSGNTTVNGGIGSGYAANVNDTTTTVAINNPTPVVTTTPTGGGGGATGGTTGTSTTGTGGSVLGASTGGMGGATEAVATLPAVGASVPVDVSALRALYHPTTVTKPVAALVSNSRRISALFLGVAATLSLIGAGLSTAYTMRRQRRTV